MRALARGAIVDRQNVRDDYYAERSSARMGQAGSSFRAANWCCAEPKRRAATRAICNGPAGLRRPKQVEC